MPELDAVLMQRMQVQEVQGLMRQIVATARDRFPVVERDNKRLISFSCNDYFGLSQDVRVQQAAVNAIEQYGVGAGASRLITGNHPLYVALESQIARMKHTEAACVFGSGYLANSGVIAALMNKRDLILADKFAHACMIDGAQLSDATFKRFAHNDLAHLERLLKAHRSEFEHCLIVTETVFSMDGDVAPIADIMALAKHYDAWVMSDDAHGLGIVESAATDIQMGTLSKAAGVYGGYICGSRQMIDYMISFARSLTYTTALPPALLASALEAMKIIESEPSHGQIALTHAQQFTTLLGLPPAQSAIVPLVIGDASTAVKASQSLAEAGFLVSAIRPPSVPAGTARLRFTFSAKHEAEHIKQLVECIKRHGWNTSFDPQRLDAAC